MTCYGPRTTCGAMPVPRSSRRRSNASWWPTGVGTMFIEPGAPWQDPFAGTFHARVWDELLEQELFQSLTEARVMREQQRRWFKEEKPHGALGDETPIEVLDQCQASGRLTMEPTTRPERRLGFSHVHDRWGGRLDHLVPLEERRAASLPQARLRGQGLSETLGGVGAPKRRRTQD